ncbi:MAG: hypothetical protein WA056_02175 [Gallionella sp.]
MNIGNTLISAPATDYTAYRLVAIDDRFDVIEVNRGCFHKYIVNHMESFTEFDDALEHIRSLSLTAQIRRLMHINLRENIDAMMQLELEEMREAA